MENSVISQPASKIDVVREQQEGKVAKYIEERTAKIPSDIFLWASLGAIGAAFGLKFSGKPHTALLVGQLAAPLMLLGIYNKMVKQQGHDTIDRVRTERSLKNR